MRARSTPSTGHSAPDLHRHLHLFSARPRLGSTPVTLLVISPDYASHLLPLATLASAFRDAGERVVVATGPTTVKIVAEFGFEHIELSLSRGSNPGVIRAEQQPAGEDDALRGFFAATRVGMIETLEFQATARLDDLLYEPVTIARRVQAIVESVRPDHVIVDHLAFSARLGLIAAGVSHADVVLGHPSTLPVGDEVYGYPFAWPAAFDPHPSQLARLRELCERVRDNFTASWNAALHELDPSSPPTADAFAGAGDLLLLNYPAQLHDDERTAMLPPHAFLGSMLRTEPLDADVEKWLEASDDAIVYVSFGSFLSVRGDVLRIVADALRRVCADGGELRVAIASGSTPIDELGHVPGGWLVREFLPQVRILGRAALAVTHGGNNSVTEAMASGVPVIVLPFSTDQFTGAAAIERHGVGEAFDPNTVTAGELAQSVTRILSTESGSSPRALASLLAHDLARQPGAERAYRAMTGSGE